MTDILVISSAQRAPGLLTSEDAIALTVHGGCDQGVASLTYPCRPMRLPLSALALASLLAVACGAGAAPTSETADSGERCFVAR
ncbi:MAG: hypothetical protein ACYC8T_05705 [Myxococcaceae bacterium]